MAVYRRLRKWNFEVQTARDAVNQGSQENIALGTFHKLCYVYDCIDNFKSVLPVIIIGGTLDSAVENGLRYRFEALNGNVCQRVPFFIVSAAGGNISDLLVALDFVAIDH